MKKTTFKAETLYALIILSLGYLIAFLTTKSIVINIAWIICGLLYIVIPAYPNPNGMVDHQKGVIGMRVAGIIVIILAIVTRFGI